MQKLISLTLGVILSAGAASALAGKQDRANLELCVADIKAIYGDGTRTRLRSVKRGDQETDMRVMVKAGSGGNYVVVCTVGSDGERSLVDQDGMALRPADASQSVSMTR